MDRNHIVSIRKMQKDDIGILYDIALRSFQQDYETYGTYPPLINLERKKFLPPRIFGKTILVNDTIIGGLFVFTFCRVGIIGAIFIDTDEQHKGYGKQVMLMIEKQYSKVKKWNLETPAENFLLHRFYESLGYVKVGEKTDKRSGIIGYVYEKIITNKSYESENAEHRI